MSRNLDAPEMRYAHATCRRTYLRIKSRAISQISPISPTYPQKRGDPGYDTNPIDQENKANESLSGAETPLHGTHTPGGGSGIIIKNSN